MKTLPITMKDDVAEVLLYDQIGRDSFFGDGISAKDFRAQVKGIKARVLNLRINSPGGSVFEASAMFEALREFRGDVHVDIDGVAASAASWVAMAGHRVHIAPGGMFMIHNPHCLAIGGAADMRAMADLLDKSKGQLLDAYAAKNGKATREQISAWMDEESWFAGQEAVAAGFAQAVTEGRQVAACAGLKELAAKLGYKRVPESLAAQDERAWQETERRRQLAASL